MKLILLGFIGIAINIWRDTAGEGGGPGPLALQQRDLSFILDRFGAEIFTRV